MKKIKMAGGLLALMAGLAPSLASAAGPSFFEPVPGDLAINLILWPIFGDLIKDGAAGPLSSALGILNGALLVAASLVAAYILIASVIGSAKDGEFMGRRWSSLWVPIRTVLGVGALYPMASGLCVAQLILGWGIVQSVGLADSAWNKFTETQLKQNVAPVAQRVPNVEALAAGLLRSSVCIEGLKQINSAGASTGTEAVVGTPQSFGSFEPGSTKTYGTAESPSLCGGVVGPVARGDGLSGKFKALFGSDKGMSEIVAAHAAATTQLEADMVSIAQHVVQGQTTSADAASYRAAVAKYEQTVSQTVRAALGGEDYFSKILAASQKDGFAMAGAYFLKLATVQNQSASAYASTGRSLPVEASPNPSIDQSLQFYLAGLTGAVGSSSASKDDFGISNVYRVDVAKRDADDSVSMYLINSLFDKLTGALFYVATDGDSISDKNPLATANAFGHVAIGAGAVGMVGSAAIDKFGFNGLAATTSAISMSLIILGGSLLFLLPMLPFIMFFSVLVGWVLAVILAVVGAPVWAFSFIIPAEGDGLAGNAKAGFMLFLGAILKPILMILGFAFATVALTPLGNFWNETFFSVYQATSGGGVAGFAGAFLAIIVYAAVLLMLTRTIFRLVGDLPEQALVWAGGAVSSISSAAGIATSAAATGAAVGAGMGAAAGAGLKSAAGAAMSKAKPSSGGTGAGSKAGSFASGGVKENPMLAGQGGSMDGAGSEAASDEGAGGSDASQAPASAGSSSGSSIGGSSGSAGERQSKPAGQAPASAAPAQGGVSQMVAGQLSNAAVGGGVHSSGGHAPERQLAKPAGGPNKPSSPRSASSAKTGSSTAEQAQAAEAEAAEAEAAAEADARAQAAAMPEMNGKA